MKNAFAQKAGKSTIRNPYLFRTGARTVSQPVLDCDDLERRVGPNWLQLQALLLSAFNQYSSISIYWRFMGNKNLESASWSRPRHLFQKWHRWSICFTICFNIYTPKGKMVKTLSLTPLLFPATRYADPVA